MLREIEIHSCAQEPEELRACLMVHSAFPQVPKGLNEELVEEAKECGLASMERLSSLEGPGSVPLRRLGRNSRGQPVAGAGESE